MSSFHWALRWILLPLIAIYSCIVVVCYPVLIAISWFSADLRMQLVNRRFTNFSGVLDLHAKVRYLVFCSSAGEYEQALPVIDRFTKQGFCASIVFFSRSGFDYAKARNEQNIYFLSPIDNAFSWFFLLRKLSPNFAIIVRHELWPAFLYMMLYYGPVYLINFSQHESSSNWSKVNRLLLLLIRRVFAVEAKDICGFSRFLSRWETAGDTKYDRVWDRVQYSLASTPKNSSIREFFLHRKILVVGSAWLPDVTLVLQGLHFAKSHLREQVALVIVPHDLSPANLDGISNAILAAGKVPALFSTVIPLKEVLSREAVLIIDRIGILFEIYGQSDLCWVGGALHFRVHNVLEPAAFNLSLAFGPKYHSQREAIHLVEGGFATVCSDSKTVGDWINHSLDSQEFRPLPLDFIKTRIGTSNQVIDRITEEAIHAR